MRFLALAVLLVGCATSTQSATTLPTGKTQVTVQLNRSTESGDGSDDTIWGGDLMVRHGFGERFDAGVHLVRTPGAADAVSAIAIDPKVRVTDADAQTQVSIGVPIGAVFAESFDDFDLGAFVLVPTIYVGQQVSPTVELVIAPKLFVTIPDEGDGIGGSSDTEAYFGGSLGIRITDPAKTWAIHPELGFTRLTSGDQTETLLTLGLGMSVGN